MVLFARREITFEVWLITTGKKEQKIDYKLNILKYLIRF